MRRFLIVVIIVFTSSLSFSQKRPVPNVINKEQELYDAIKADREIVRQYIISGNSDVKNYIDKFHTYRYRSNKTYILDFNERLIAQFASSSFKSIIEDINKNQHLKRRVTDNLQHYDPILKNEEATIKSISQRILDNINKSNLDDYEKELLTLYYKTTINKLYNSFYITYFKQKDINDQSKALIPFAKKARQKAFIQRKIIAQTEINSIFAYSINVLTGQVYTGSYSKHLSPSINLLGISLSIIKKRIYFSGSIYYNIAKIKSDIPDKELWIQGEEVRSNIFELGIGYPFILSKRLIIAPVINAVNFSYELVGVENTSTQSQTTFNLSANIHLKFSPKMQRASDKLHAFRLKPFLPNSLNLSVEYQPVLEKDKLGLSGGAFIFKLGIGVF